MAPGAAAQKVYSMSMEFPPPFFLSVRGIFWASFDGKARSTRVVPRGRVFSLPLACFVTLYRPQQPEMLQVGYHLLICCQPPRFQKGLILSRISNSTNFPWAKITRPYIRPIPVADGRAGAEIRVFALSNSIITNGRTDGRTDGRTYGRTKPLIESLVCD